MSIVNALKKLVVALGGASDPDAVPGSNVADVVDQVTAQVIYEKDIPKVIYTDAVLTSQSGGTWTSELDFSQLCDAWKLGIPVISNVKDGYGEYVADITFSYIDEGGCPCTLAYISGLGVVLITVMANGTFTVTSMSSNSTNL